MLKELRDLLMKIVNDIDSDNSNIDESQTIEIASAIGELVSRYNKPKVPNKLTRLEACKHLNCCKYTKKKDANKIFSDLSTSLLFLTIIFNIFI